jgi:hypothetical protein
VSSAKGRLREIRFSAISLIYKIMLFSNTEIPELNFTFNGRTNPITNSHKHLGVTFSSDAKWNIHIEHILSSIYYKTFVIFSFFFFLSMIPSLTLYKLEWNYQILEDQ